MKKVSVIVPVYNGQEYIERALDALVGQTLGEAVEIIVVNDGSVDGTAFLLDQYKERYCGRIQVIETRNHGAAHARNIGLSVAQGEYVGFVDCDDSVDLTMFEKMYKLGVSEEADIVTCGYYRIDGSDIQKRDYTARQCFGLRAIQAPDLLRRNVPYIWNKIFKRSFLLDHNLAFDESLRVYEDLLFTYTSFLYANKVVRVPECLYSYMFSREGSLTYTFSDKRFDLFPAFDSLLTIYKGKGVFYHFEDELLYILLTHIYAAFHNDVFSSRHLFSIMRFYRESVKYLDTNFSWWRQYDLYFKTAGKSRLFDTHVPLVFLKAAIPVWASILNKTLNGLFVRLHRQRAGLAFANEWKRPLDQDLVFIDSQHGANLSGNMFYILLELLTTKRYKGKRVVLTFKSNRVQAKMAEMLELYNLDCDRVIFCKQNSVEHARRLARARTIFSDTSLPTYYVKKPGQIYVNTWHGTPLKHLGADIKTEFANHGNLSKNFTVADYLCFQGDYMRTCMEGAYMYGDVATNRYAYLGYPRNTVLFNKERALEVRACLSLQATDQVICYMPTWKGKNNNIDSSGVELQSMLEEWNRSLDSSQIVFVALHPFDKGKVNFSVLNRMREFPSGYETYDVLNACDVLVTDYSSVMFDFGALRREVLIFAPDIESYSHERGMYLNLDDLGFPVSQSVDELIDSLATVREGSFQSAESLAAELCPFESADSASEICRLAFEGKAFKGGAVADSKPKDNCTLLFTNDFSDSSLLEDWVRYSDAYANAGVPLYVTYSIDFMNNDFILKKLNDKTMQFGVMGAFGCTTSADRVVLSLLDSYPDVALHFGHRLNDVMHREWKRAYGTSRFARTVVRADSSLTNLLFSTCADGESVLYIDEAAMHNLSNIPRRVLERFDRLLISNERVRCAVASNLPDCRLMLGDITDLISVPLPSINY